MLIRFLAVLTLFVYCHSNARADERVTSDLDGETLCNTQLLRALETCAESQRFAYGSGLAWVFSRCAAPVEKLSIHKAGSPLDLELSSLATVTTQCHVIEERADGGATATYDKSSGP